MSDPDGTPTSTTPASTTPSPATPAAAARLSGRLVLGDDGHESGAAIAKVATGIGGFDHVAMGGLPAGRTTVVAGPAGAAKTLFAAQFLAEGVRLGQPGVFVTLEEPALDLRTNLRTLGWDVAAWEASGDWRFVDGSPLAPGSSRDQRPYDIDTLVAQIGVAIDRTGAQRLALDSLNAVLALQDDAAAARQVLRALVLQLRTMHLTVVLTVETVEDPGGSLSPYGIEEFVADNVVLLRNVREGTFRRRTVEVLKMRGAMHHKGDVPFTVVPGEGLRVLPVTAPRAATRPQERVTSGVPGLDELLRGGYVGASNTLVSGPTGAGKTMLATQFAGAGVDAGETVLFLAFEESREQVLANGAAVGHDLRGAEQEGRLQVVAIYPEVASLDDHLVEVRALVERLQPQRLVLDGLSTLARLGSEQSYRGFLIGMTGIARDADLAALLTTSVTPGDAVAPGATQVTGLVDTIVVLGHDEREGVRRRRLHVQRMRGSGHTEAVHEVAIRDGEGLVVVGTFT